MRSEGCILKYLTHNFPIGTKLPKYALPENAELENYDVKTEKMVPLWQNEQAGNVGATGLLARSNIFN